MICDNEVMFPVVQTVALIMLKFKKDFSKFRPIIAKEVRNFSKRYNTHLSAHLQVYKNFIDIEVIYLGTDFFL